MDQIDKMIAWENGELSDQETTDLFASLIQSGVVWSLQGMYGRFAQQLIKAGYLTDSGEKGDNYAW